MACERARKTWRNSSYWVKPSPIGGGSLSLLFECKRKLGVAYRSSSNCTFALRSGLPMAFPTPLISTDRGRQTPWPVTPCAHPLHSYISLARGGRGSAKCGGHNLALWTGLQLLALQPATLFQYFPFPQPPVLNEKRSGNSVAWHPAIAFKFSLSRS